ncbi:SLC13 family permease [Desulfitobacterium sp. AusDCA]|uniref:SLC13 family permease n=1 Tax=Desulfitobacterium sp. AusDCA TaxID=3240383 RepID=UPI003DA799E6
MGQVEVEKKPQSSFSQYKKLIGLIVCVIIGLAIWFGPPIAGLPRHGQLVLASAIVLILALIFEIMDIGSLCMLWAVFLIITQLEKPKVALDGFLNTTTWLVLGAFMIGQAAVKTNLAKRVAYRLMSVAGDSYRRIVIMLYVIGWILGAFIPSGTARMAVIFPIFVGLLEAFKAEPNTPESLDLMLQVKWAFSTGGPSIAWLTGSLVNPIVMSVLTKVSGQTVSWAQWALWMLFPTITIAVLMFFTTTWFTKAKPVIEGGMDKIKAELSTMGSMKKEEKVAAFWMVLAVILWATGDATDIDPAWAAMLVGILLFAPKIGVLKKKDLKELDWSMFLFCGAAISLATVVSEAKIDQWAVGAFLTPLIAPLSKIGVIGSYSGLWIFSYIMHIIIPSGTATVAAVAPLTIQYAVAHGLNPILIAFLTDFANRPFLFPYQIMSIMLLWGFAKPSIGRAAKVLGLQSIVWFFWSLIMILYLDLLI